MEYIVTSSDYRVMVVIKGTDYRTVFCSINEYNFIIRGESGEGIEQLGYSDQDTLSLPLLQVTTSIIIK
jgi:hypothetical protein